MKDFLKKNVLPLMSMLISVVTLLLFWCRFSPFTWDSFGVMATFLGVIVTFLVGFQIWAIIDTKEFKKSIKKENEIINEQLKNVVYQDLMNRFVISFEFSMVYHETATNLFAYLKFSLQAIDLGITCNEIDKCNLVIKGMIDVVEYSNMSFTDKQQKILLSIFYNFQERALLIKELKNNELQYIEERIRKAIIT